MKTDKVSKFQWLHHDLHVLTSSKKSQAPEIVFPHLKQYMCAHSANVPSSVITCMTIYNSCKIKCHPPILLMLMFVKIPDFIKNRLKKKRFYILSCYYKIYAICI